MTALPEAYFRAEVLEVSDLSSVMRRVVLGGDGLADYRSSGAPDEWFRLMVPPQRQTQVELPTKHGQQFHFANPQPAPRWYSLRRWDADQHQLTVDVVVHAQGAATRWATAVQPGDQLLVSQPHGRGIDTEADWVLVLADQTGVPAASRILESLAPHQHAHAVFEAPNEAATFTPTSPAHLKVCWAYNPDPSAIPSPLSAAVRTIELPPGQGYVWMAGEASCARDVPALLPARAAVALPALRHHRLLASGPGGLPASLPGGRVHGDRGLRGGPAGRSGPPRRSWTTCSR